VESGVKVEAEVCIRVGISFTMETLNEVLFIFPLLLAFHFFYFFFTFLFFFSSVE